MTGVTLDTGALIALDKNDRRVIAVLARALQVGAKVTVPTTCFAQAIRQPARQVRLARLIRQPGVVLKDLNGLDATQVGLLLSQSRTTDIVDAHVVICARRNAQSIMTSDVRDSQKLDPRARLIAV